MKLAGLRVRLLSMLYDAVLIAAVLLAATAIFVALFGDSRQPPLKTGLQMYLLAVAGIYLIGSWTNGRRTLAMRTWRLHLVQHDGGPLSLRAALVRYLCAVLGVLLCGIGLLWALVDPEKQFLHDRIAGTRIVLDSERAAR